MKNSLAIARLVYLIFHQQNIAHGRKCVQYYSVRRAVIPFTDCGLLWNTGFSFLERNWYYAPNDGCKWPKSSVKCSMCSVLWFIMCLWNQLCTKTCATTICPVPTNYTFFGIFFIWLTRKWNEKCCYKKKLELGKSPLDSDFDKIAFIHSQFCQNQVTCGVSV